MEPILDLVKSYLTDASKGEAEISPKLVRESKKACGDALKKQFSPNKKKHHGRHKKSKSSFNKSSKNYVKKYKGQGR